MIEFKCNSKNSPNGDHKWINHTPSSWTINGFKPAYFICEFCNQLISVAELIQFEALQNQTKLAKHQLGFQKGLSVLAFIVSVVAILIALLK